MAKYDELPVYKASYDLLVEIFRFTKEFNRGFKYTVGESLKKETLELITLIYRANSKADKREILQSGREQIEVIRLFVRLMRDLKQISRVPHPLCGGLARLWWGRNSSSFAVIFCA
jgi:hypothetical protein